MYFPAKLALAQLIRGINIQWNLPIDYFLVSGSCDRNKSNNIMPTIEKLKKNSLKIKVQAKVLILLTLVKMYMLVHQNLNFYVNKQRIIYIFDPPHLLKSMRNMFFKHNFFNNEKFINNKYLMHFYNKDLKINIRSTPKLSYAPIHSELLEKMRVYLVR